MNTLTPHQQKVLDTEGHLALTANAGSGKTFVLARKYLSALIKENLEISNIAAITFTEKAASELYSKISSLIDDQIKEEVDFQIKKRLEIIRRQLISANISTIHSFCIDILRSYPVEAKLDARFIPIDENLSSELIELSVEEMIQSAFNNPLIVEDLKYLIRIFSSKARLEKELIKLIKDRKNVFVVKKNIYSKTLNEITDHFEKIFEETFQSIWQGKKKIFIEGLSEINSVVLSKDSSNQIALEVKVLLSNLENCVDTFLIIETLNKIKSLAFTDKYQVRKAKYLSGDLGESLQLQINFGNQFINEFKNVINIINPKESEQELAKFGSIVINLFDSAMENYELRKRAEGYIDYEDILLHTKILLENEDVQKSLNEKYKFILVDEFQDTNEIQYEIFLPILDYLKKGKLFIVGDEKQSIYKFRDAEIEIFNLTRDDIKSKSGQNNLLVLPDSFRMTPAICTFCNHVFQKLFSDPNELYGEVPATDLVCARDDVNKGKVELLINRISELSKESDEEELVAKKILALVIKDRYSFKDICILVRKRKHFKELEQVFLEYKIPYTIAGGRGFYQRQTISDIFNYLSFLADENNSAALIGILRSPFFSISDSILFEISLQKVNSYWKKFNNYVESTGNYQFVIKILNENLALCNSIELPQLLNKIITDRDYLSILINREDGIQEAANIDKLISIARNFNAKGFRNLYDFISNLKESISGIEDEAQAAISNQSNSVQMMTIHQAKGLEFPIVFLFKTSDQGQSGSVKAGQIQVNKKFGLLAKIPLHQNFTEDFIAAPIVTQHNFIEEKKNNAELKRLLYVALTRAKNELYISASLEPEKTLVKDSFIKLLGEGLENDFSGKELLIKNKLNYLKKDNGSYKTISEEIVLPIPITSEIAEVLNLPEAEMKSENVFESGIQKIQSGEKEEIISATKVSLYNQCPLKYYLTYEFGFGKLNSERLSRRRLASNKYQIIVDEETEIDDRIIESDINLSKDYDSAFYGTTVHKILEQEISPDKLADYLSEINIDGGDIQSKLRNDLERYFESNFYKEINALKKYKNELEIYVKENEYYLHGIVDKLILDDNKIRIVDYKTDDIKQNEIKKQAELYLTQLKFYLYIASRLFKEFELFEGNLVFIQYPDNPVKISFNRKNLYKLNKEIESIILALRQKEKTKNISHCSECPYSRFTKKCIIN
jgi:ATP-dependent helicase/nuclease subunit A